MAPCRNLLSNNRKSKGGSAQPGGFRRWGSAGGPPSRGVRRVGSAGVGPPRVSDSVGVKGDPPAQVCHRVATIRKPTCLRASKRDRTYGCTYVRTQVHTHERTYVSTGGPPNVCRVRKISCSS